MAVIIDLYLRAVIGWSMNKRMKTELITDALKMALMRRKVRSPLLLHSDQGSQYAAADYREMLADNGIECSMSRKGNCWDMPWQKASSTHSKQNWFITKAIAVVLKQRPASLSTLKCFTIVRDAIPISGK